MVETILPLFLEFPMTTNQVIILARKHVHNPVAMRSSAELCLADAVRLQDEGNLNAAKARALKSLAYSVGILHADYRRACKGEVVMAQGDLP